MTARNLADAPDNVANQECRRRYGYQREQCDHRILHHHHGDQPDERETVPGERGDQKRKHAAGGACRKGDLGDELRGMPIGEIAEVFTQQLPEYPPLIFGSNGVAGPRQDDGLTINGETLRGHYHEE